MMTSRDTCAPSLPAGAIFNDLLPRTRESYERELRLQRATMAWLRASIAEVNVLVGLKDALLQQQEAEIRQHSLQTREADHRMKNDLQMIVSVLALQSRQSANREAALQLAAAAARVAAIERLHRRLHALEGVRTVAFREYLEGFCGDLSTMATSAECPNRTIIVEGASISLPASVANALAYIANELVTNAVKHGEGRIAVRLEQNAEQRCSLSVSNDGPGLPEGFHPGSGKGLGMKIVLSFVRQIGGELHAGCGDCDRGARFTVIFPLPPQLAETVKGEK